MPTFDQAYFDKLYQEQGDPWNFRRSSYEQQKYALTIEALGDVRVVRGLELGCSIGVLTRLLSDRCDQLVAVDTSALALEQARIYCDGCAVDFRQAHLPEGDLGADYDLVVASEVLYYLERDSLRRLGERLRERVREQALLVAVHWTGATDYPLTADEATEIFFDYARIQRLRGGRCEGFRWDVGFFV